MFSKLFSGIIRLSNAVNEMADIFEHGNANLRQNVQPIQSPIALEHEEETPSRLSKERNGKHQPVKSR